MCTLHFWSVTTRDSILNSSPTKPYVSEEPQVAGIVRTFLDTENVRLLPWTARSSDLSPTENVWSMVAKRLACYHTPVTTINDLWHRVEVKGHLVHCIHSQFYSIPRRISAIITVRGGCPEY
ncbi:hypothetical protein TNCV_3858191 [Trichonephila clavipes]|nr:hypothetical protein TNCV_3858191 [Trichonephila clavipes]